MGRGQGALLEEGHPKQVLVIAQSTTAAFQMRFLHVNRVAKFRVARRLVVHAQLDVFTDMTAHATLTKRRPKTRGQGGIAGERTRLEHGRFREHVLVRLIDRFIDRAGGVANLETDIPKQVKDLFDHLGRVRRNLSAIFLVEKHDVDVAEWVELAASVTAECEEGERGRGGAAIAQRESDCRLEDALHQNIDQFDPQRADFATTAAVLMAKPEAVLFDLQEFLVKRQRFDRPHCPRRGELALCVRENLSEMTRSGHR